MDTLPHGVTSFTVSDKCYIDWDCYYSNTMSLLFVISGEELIRGNHEMEVIMNTAHLLSHSVSMHICCVTFIKHTIKALFTVN